MRWDHLFDDLSGQLEHELSAEEADLRHEEERLRLGKLTLRERIVALRSADDPADRALRMRLLTGETASVIPLTVGRDWLAGDLDGRSGVQVVVPFWSIDSLMLSAAQVETSLVATDRPPELAARLGISFLLRDLCRRRSTITLDMRSGTLTGTIDRVGRDHVDVAVHDREEPRRASAVDHVRVVPVDQVLVLRL